MKAEYCRCAKSGFANRTVCNACMWFLTPHVTFPQIAFSFTAQNSNLQETRSFSQWLPWIQIATVFDLLERPTWWNDHDRLAAVPKFNQNLKRQIQWWAGIDHRFLDRWAVGFEVLPLPNSCTCISNLVGGYLDQCPPLVLWSKLLKIYEIQRRIKLPVQMIDPTFLNSYGHQRR